jgi:acetyltransferase-like isoleucine patch superfamily enzyme
MKRTSYCKKCLLPSTKTNVKFSPEQICSTCLYCEIKLDVKNKIRWEKRSEEFEGLIVYAKKFNFYKNSSIHHNSYIIDDVKVKDNTFIGLFTILDESSAGLQIGSNTSTAAGVQIYSHNLIAGALSGHKISEKYGSVKIGDNCFIGPNSVITQGLTIGDNCFIWANSVVIFDVKSNLEVSGNPSKIIGKVQIIEGKVIISK